MWFCASKYVLSLGGTANEEEHVFCRLYRKESVSNETFKYLRDTIGSFMDAHLRSSQNILVVFHLVELIKISRENY